MEEVVTPAGTIQILYQITLGDMVISLLLSMILIFFFLTWLLDTIWKRG